MSSVAVLYQNPCAPLSNRGCFFRTNTDTKRSNNPMRYEGKSAGFRNPLSGGKNTRASEDSLLFYGLLSISRYGEPTVQALCPRHSASPPLPGHPHRNLYFTESV
ncbi:hypothetical protein AMATHDRAFT_66736, partial [Amanita thiersii Skay4041]